MNTRTELVEEGVAALISGRKAQARLLLGQALEADPHSEKAWLWLSGAVDSDEERRFCLRQVLSINEWNSAAQKGLKELGPGLARSPLAPPALAAPREPPVPAVTPAPIAEAVKPEPATPEAPAWSQWRQEADPAEAVADSLPGEGSVPKGWIVAAAILAAGLVIGLALLLVISSGILGK